MTAVHRADRVPVAEPASRRRPGTSAPHAPSISLVLNLQRAAGNAAVAGRLAAHRPGADVRTLQRCGPTPCGCSADERAEHAAAHPEEALSEPDAEAPAAAPVPVQRAAGEVPPTGAQAGPAAVERARALVRQEIATARQRLAGQDTLAVPASRLAELDRKVAASGLTLPAVGGEPAPADGEQTVAAGTVDALLASLEVSLAGPGGAPEAAPVQRFLDPATAAALAAAGVAAGETVEGGAVIAGAAAPETGGVSLVALGAAALVVGVVVGIVVYATYEPETTAGPQAPVMPEGLSKAAKEKWKECFELHEVYDKGSKKKVSDLGAQMKSLTDGFNNNRLTPEQLRQLCAMVYQQLINVDRLIVDRKAYMDRGCDEIHWFPDDGTTKEQREKKHQGALNGVRTQQANLRTLLARLQAKGAC